MKTTELIAVVTGPNRGIGFAIIRQLARADAQVLLTARKPEAGKDALHRLTGEGLRAEVRPLDPTESWSLRALVERLATPLRVNPAHAVRLVRDGISGVTPWIHSGTRLSGTAPGRPRLNS